MEPTHVINSGEKDELTVTDLNDDNHYVRIARENWLGTSVPRKVRPDVLKRDIWDTLEGENFSFRSLSILENLQILERYLWPTYTDDSSNQHVLLIVLLLNVKSRGRLPTWAVFSGRPTSFPSLFHRVLSMSLDSGLAAPLRTQLLSFVLHAFQSLDVELVRKECVPLVSIAVWHNLFDPRARETRIESNAYLKRAWRAAGKRYDAADEEGKAKLRFDRLWLYSMILDFLDRLYDSRPSTSEDAVYSERFLELLTDLESQLPTRRYVNALLHDLNLLPAIKLSPFFGEDKNELFRDLYGLLRHFAYFSVDDHTGTQLSLSESDEAHYKILARLQRVSLKNFPDKLTILALSNYASVDKRDELQGHLSQLTDDELVDLGSKLGFRTSYPKKSKLVQDRAFYTEIILAAHERRKTFQETAAELSICPTEETLFEPTLLRNEVYDGSRPLAIPKLNLQYLTVGDFLWRSFILHRCEAFFEIRTHIESTLSRLRPHSSGPDGVTKFDGFSRMALPMTKPAILDVAPPKVGQDIPPFVRAEITLDLSRLGGNIQKEWESLRPDDVVFLLALNPTDGRGVRGRENGSQTSAQSLGVAHLRTAEVVQVCDENGRPLRDNRATNVNGYDNFGARRPRKLVVHLDAEMYKIDSERTESGKPDVYESLNLIVRRRGRENNFKPILSSLKSLILSDVPMPSWLQEVFLGYGDPAAANYKRLPNRIPKFDFRDTFLNWEHLVESFPGKAVECAEKGGQCSGSLSILEMIDGQVSAAPERPTKRRRRNEPEPTANEEPQSDMVKVQTYNLGKTGPYPTDAPKLNHVRFTPKQVEAIVSGSQPGLTVIVGPPGTGKTDVATQIINNLYHNFPSQRTLLIAHSNQALNQLFQKIINLDIDERHLLRLGHGEEDLESDSDYSKHGRVESFLQNRSEYLREVDRLAECLNAPGAHGNSCETAAYFNTVYVEPAWHRYQDGLRDSDTTTADLIDSFPFTAYFANAPQPLFPPDASASEVTDIALGCYRHIEKIFSELEDIRPFEILRSARDKANYLLVKEARVIAMTSTHAAMRRQEIASLGFHYDNVVMEEAAQITEMENFIPLALQNSKDGMLPLQRVVLCGDHLQNSPIVQNLAFRHYANLDQSLFLRLIRLGVPTINLDQQGRARPSIARLYQWRYQELGNLPIVETNPEFQKANAGFRYEYQFINVPDYKGVGETEPSPHFLQNLGEAEYAVAIYQYMRLLGYPASRITILTTYAGQRALIRDVLQHRCAKNSLFGLPRIVATVDKYQGEQNDFVILSMTRTKRIGFLRDIRRLTVALSRARLGLYILGRRAVLESCHEYDEGFKLLFERPDRLELTTGEMYSSCSRNLDDEVGTSTMEGVEHLGQYVYEMTQAKIAALKAGAENATALAPTTAADTTVDDEDEEEPASYMDDPEE
ncbi:MAG: hypothetical protein M1823_001284 [Watsoniomyces obsoletus]|nr:MAG: hypothetical protein M1823_001284 [Watsoniomyces obsoletus]